MSAEDDRDVSGRLVEQYDTLVELDVAVFIRAVAGWTLVSAGEVRSGRWWAEYEHAGRAEEGA